MNFFKQMLSEKLYPDSFTLNTIMDGYIKKGEIEKAKIVFK